MRIVGETKIDFMGKRGLCLALSLIAILGAVGMLWTKGIKRGVEFEGGAHVILHYVEAPEIEAVRAQIIDAGLSGGSVTAFGDTGGSEIVVRVPLPAGESTAEQAAEEEAEGGEKKPDLATRVVDALRPPEIREKIALKLVDLNVADEVTLTSELIENGGLDPVSAEQVAAALTEVRRNQAGVFNSLDEALAVPGVTEEAAAFMREKAFTGPFALRGQEFIEASISAEMRNKAYGAVLGALLGMLVYIWVRFQFQWGLAAILALVHDTAITLGLFSLAGLEANLPVVAAFLTLVGYSVNDTIVVFDRIRENLKNRGTGKLVEVINLSINQNLSRTLITSLTTLLAVGALFFLGGPVIHPFAFVLLFGVIIGTYSSMFIAAPVLVLWQNLFGKKQAVAAKGTGAGRKARA